MLAELGYSVPANDAVKIGAVRLDGQGLVKMSWTCDGENGRNHFLYGAPPFEWPRVKMLLAK